MFERPERAPVVYTPSPISKRPRMGRYQARALIGDLVALVVAALAAFFVRGIITPENQPGRGLQFFAIVGMTVGWLLVLTLAGAYQPQAIGLGAEEFKRVVSATGIAFGAVAAVAFLLHSDVPRAFVLIAFPLGLIGLLLNRWVNRTWLANRWMRGIGLRTFIVVGTTESVRELMARIDDPHRNGIDVVEALTLPGTLEQEVSEWLDTLDTQITVRCANGVIMSGPHPRPQVLSLISLRLEDRGVELLLAPEYGDALGLRASIRPLFSTTLISINEPQLSRVQTVLKRAFDVSAALTALVVLSPLLLVAAILIKITSRGPVLFDSQRLGLFGEPFRFLKFRTMTEGSELLRSQTLGTPDEGMAQRYRDDPRITGLGRFLRRWSIDELPQLVNVLTGKMAIVGPRPILPDELGLLERYEHRRHIIKPGLTGLWQISGRKETSWEDRVQLDLYYVSHWSIALDMVIAAKTVRVVVSGEGAY